MRIRKSIFLSQKKKGISNNIIEEIKNEENKDDWTKEKIINLINKESKKTQRFSTLENNNICSDKNLRFKMGYNSNIDKSNVNPSDENKHLSLKTIMNFDKIENNPPYNRYINHSLILGKHNYIEERR